MGTNVEAEQSRGSPVRDRDRGRSSAGGPTCDGFGAHGSRGERTDRVPGFDPVPNVNPPDPRRRQAPTHSEGASRDGSGPGHNLREIRPEHLAQLCRGYLLLREIDSDKARRFLVTFLRGPSAGRTRDHRNPFEGYRGTQSAMCQGGRTSTWGRTSSAWNRGTDYGAELVMWSLQRTDAARTRPEAELARLIQRPVSPAGSTWMVPGLSGGIAE